MNQGSEIVCSICTDTATNPYKTSCSHDFCIECLLKWVNTQYENKHEITCPNCRSVIKRDVLLKEIRSRNQKSKTPIDENIKYSFAEFIKLGGVDVADNTVVLELSENESWRDSFDSLTEVKDFSIKQAQTKISRSNMFIKNGQGVSNVRFHLKDKKFKILKPKHDEFNTHNYYSNVCILDVTEEEIAAYKDIGSVFDRTVISKYNFEANEEKDSKYFYLKFVVNSVLEVDDNEYTFDDPKNNPLEKYTKMYVGDVTFLMRITIDHNNKSYYHRDVCTRLTIKKVCQPLSHLPKKSLFRK